MTTTYEGREEEHDLGDGCSFTWLYDSGEWLHDDLEPVGLIEHHPKPDGAPGLYCGGYVLWRESRSGGAVKHHLIAGGPGDEARLTVEPSLLCRTCGHHGHISEGRWVS